MLWSFLFTRHLCTTRVVVIIYIHKLMLIRILSSDWPISIQVPSKLKKNRMHFYFIQVRSSFLIQVSCMVYTIKKLEFKKLEWRLGCKTCIVYTGLKYTALRNESKDLLALNQDNMSEWRDISFCILLFN